MKILVAGALPQELKPLLHHVKPQEHLQTRSPSVQQATYLGHELAVVVTGVGMHNAAQAVGPILDAFHPDLLISMGFAGALYEGAAVGDVIMAATVSLVSRNPLKVTESVSTKGRLLTGRLDTINIRSGTFFTLETPMDKKSTRALVPAETLYPVCDMETFPLSDLARKREIEFLAARSITDRLDEEIPPEFFTIAESSGIHQHIKAASALLRKPQLIFMAARLALRSRKASKNLWLFFDAVARVL